MAQIDKDTQVGTYVVFHDQGGRGNPRFCKIVKKTPCFFVFQQVGSKSVDKYPEIPNAYRSDFHYIMHPLWDDDVGKTFRNKIESLPYITVYDADKEYINSWYD